MAAVVTIAVGALHDQRIGMRDHGGIAHDRHVIAANVAAVDERAAQSVVCQLKLQRGCSQDVAGLVQSQAHAREDVLPRIVIEAAKLPQRVSNILGAVEWLHRWQALACATPRFEFRIAA